MKKLIIFILCFGLILAFTSCDILNFSSPQNTQNLQEENIRLSMPWDITGEYFLSYAHNPRGKTEESKFDKASAPKMLYIDRKDMKTTLGPIECYTLSFNNFETEQLEPIIKASKDEVPQIFVEFKTKLEHSSSSEKYDIKVTIPNENTIHYTITDLEGNLIESYDFFKAKIRCGTYKCYNDNTENTIYPLTIKKDKHSYNLLFNNRYKAVNFAEGFDLDDDASLKERIVYEKIPLTDITGEFNAPFIDMTVYNPLNLYTTAEINFYSSIDDTEPESYFVYGNLDEITSEYDYCGEYLKDDEHSTSEKIMVYKNHLEIDDRYTMEFEAEDLFTGWRPLEITDSLTGKTSLAKSSVYFDEKNAYFSVYSVNGDYDIYARGKRKLDK